MNMPPSDKIQHLFGIQISNSRCRISHGSFFLRDFAVSVAAAERFFGVDSRFLGSALGPLAVLLFEVLGGGRPGSSGLDIMVAVVALRHCVTSEYGGVRIAFLKTSPSRHERCRMISIAVRMFSVWWEETILNGYSKSLRKDLNVCGSTISL